MDIEIGNDRRPRLAVLLPVIVVLAILQAVALYFNAFAVQPAGDDFDLIRYVRIGHTHGWTWFWLNHPPSYFRPAKHMVAWLIGDTFPHHPAFAFRSLHFFVFWLYLTVFVAWLRWMRVHWLGSLAATLVFLVHPGTPATLSSIDGFGGLFATVCIWTGILLVIRFRNSSMLAGLSVALCFAAGSVFKEYVLSLLLLTPAAIILFRGHKTLLRSLVEVMTPLVLVFALYMLARHLLMPGGPQGVDSAITRSPIKVAENLVLAATISVLPGDSIKLYFHHSLPVLLAVGSLMVAVAGVVGLGIFRVSFRHNGGATHPFREPKTLLFLALAVILATFPCILLASHFAEKYFAPLLLPLSLLLGAAAEGLRTAGLVTRVLASLVAITAAVSSATAVLDKNAHIRGVGDRAAHILEQARKGIPDPAKPATIRIAFIATDVASQPKYSVFVIPDHILIGDNTYLFNWQDPSINVCGGGVLVNSADDAAKVDADYVFLWNPKLKTATRIR